MPISAEPVVLWRLRDVLVKVFRVQDFEIEEEKTSASRYIGRFTFRFMADPTVRGIYRSNGGGNDSWLLDDGRGQTLTVRGNLPKNGRVGDTVTVTGTVRQTRGRLTLENN